jgi:hypothetical protein
MDAILTPAILDQIKQQFAHYEESDGTIYKIECKPVPRPDYELKYGGPYSHIINAFYCENWCCTFGLRTNGELILWAD